MHGSWLTVGGQREDLPLEYLEGLLRLDMRGVDALLRLLGTLCRLRTRYRARRLEAEHRRRIVGENVRVRCRTIAIGTVLAGPSVRSTSGVSNTVSFPRIY